MKKILYIILFICLLTFGVQIAYGQTDLKTVVATVEELRKSQGDYIARNYVQELLETTSDNEMGSVLISFFFFFFSNIWQTDKSESITNEYQDYLESIIVPAINDNTFQINNITQRMLRHKDIE